MSAHECSLTELCSLFHYLPELIFVLIGSAGYIYEVDCNNTLVESSVVLVITLIVILRMSLIALVAESFRYILIVRCKETSASHARIYVSALEFFHLLS